MAGEKGKEAAMRDWSELRRKAESKKAEGFELTHNIPCSDVLALIDEVEDLRRQLIGIRLDRVELGLTVADLKVDLAEAQLSRGERANG